jgi:hypothetical protein
MAEKMNYTKAIEKRSSRRTYTDKPIDKSCIEHLNNLITLCNNESDLNLQLHVNDDNALIGLKMSYGLFKNVQNYIALVGKKDDKNLLEKLGYYGEKIVLEATLLDLGTCWVGGTYDKKTCKCEVAENETLIGIITIGHVPDDRTWKEKMIYSLTHRRTKEIKDMLFSDTEIPSWMLEAMIAVQRAPSAVNMQPVRFEYKNGQVRATILRNKGYELIDLGIAKLHFEIGSGYRGKWERGLNSLFVVN